MSNDSDEFMGGGARSVPFETIGDTVTGLVLAPPEKRQQTDPDTGGPKTFSGGEVRWMFAVRIQTELRDPADPADTGERSLFLKWKSLDAVRNAVRATGAAGLLPGGILTLTLTGFGPKTKSAWNPPKLWSASYIPPDPNVAFMATPGPAPQAAAPAPVAPPRPSAEDQAATIARLRATAAQAQARQLDPAEMAAKAAVRADMALDPIPF